MFERLASAIESWPGVGLRPVDAEEGSLQMGAQLLSDLHRHPVVKS